MESYRSRRRRSPSERGQSRLPFSSEDGTEPRVALQEPPSSQPAAPIDDFSFTIAIGRCKETKGSEEAQFLIDVSPPATDLNVPASVEAATPESRGAFPVASLEERRLAAIADAICLVFACGSFLALFGSLGGHFAFSKLNAAVYSIAFAIVYVQYFCLFTVFGGTTPGMMLRGLRVADFSGEAPSPRQLILRATGYLLSGGTFFLGFLWASWDEDSLTWHDRLSHTYLSASETLSEADLHAPSPQR